MIAVAGSLCGVNRYSIIEISEAGQASVRPYSRSSGLESADSMGSRSSRKLRTNLGQS